MDFDVIIAGLGAMGAAAAFQLARAGVRLLGCDRFRPPHNQGSSHGRTRIIREAYFEHPAYVPLVQRAYELWQELERTSSTQLFHQTGGFMIGPPSGPLFSGAKLSAETHHLRHEVLSHAALVKRLPVFIPGAGMSAVWEPRAGVLFPERAVETNLQFARAAGARLEFDQPVLGWEPSRDGVRVVTSSSQWTARRLLLTSGPWIGELLGGFRLPVTVERQVMCWFEPHHDPECFRPEAFPIFICEYEPRHYFYGFPNFGDGIKVAIHHQGEVTNPNDVRREVMPEEVEKCRTLLQKFLPAANGTLKQTAVCLYTNSPDEHFILDWHPKHKQVFIASPCSGHGFKFCLVIGEICAQLLIGQPPAFDLSLFSLKRFQA